MEGSMMKPAWSKWPNGERECNVDPETLRCPVCGTRLLPLKRIVGNENSELWRFGCIQCKTTYLVSQPAGITQPAHIPSMMELMEKIEKLERTVEMLLHQSHRQIQYPNHASSEEKNNVDVDISTRYGFLLRSK